MAAGLQQQLLLALHENLPRLNPICALEELLHQRERLLLRAGGAPCPTNPASLPR